MGPMDMEGNNASQTFQDRISTVGVLSEQLLSSLLQKSENSYLKGFIFILKLSGLYSFKKSLSRFFTYFIVFTMWFSILIVFLNFFLYSSSKYFYHQVGNLLWMIHSATTYTIIAYDMIFLNGRILVFMNTISCGPNKENQEISQNFQHTSSFASTSYCQKLTQLSWYTSVGVYLVVGINVFCIIYLYIFLDGLYFVLRVTKSLWFDLLGVGLWYFFSYGWVISLPVVCLPAYALHCRIRTFIDFIKITNQTHTSTPTLTVDSTLSPPISQSSKSLSLLTVEKIMEWYDELHAANRLFIMNVSLLLTVDILLCSILSVFLLHVCPFLMSFPHLSLSHFLSSVICSRGVASSCLLSCLCLAHNQHSLCLHCLNLSCFTLCSKFSHH
jgi:hypothetical protein